MPQKPPSAPVQPARAPAPHVQTAVRAAQAKLPETRQASPQQHPAFLIPRNSQAAHVQRAVTPVQAKLPALQGLPQAPHVRSASDSVQAKLSLPAIRPASGEQARRLHAHPTPFIRPGQAHGGAAQAKIEPPNTKFNDLHLKVTVRQKVEAMQEMLEWYYDTNHTLNGSVKKFKEHIDDFVHETFGSPKALRAQQLQRRWLGLGVTEPNEPEEGLKYIQEITVILNNWEAATKSGAADQGFARRESLDDDLGVAGRDRALAAYTRRYLGLETKSHAHHGANYSGGTTRGAVLRNLLDGVHSSKGPATLAAIQKDYPDFRYEGSYRS